MVSPMGGAGLLIGLECFWVDDNFPAFTAAVWTIASRAVKHFCIGESIVLHSVKALLRENGYGLVGVSVELESASSDGRFIRTEAESETTFGYLPSHF